MRSFYLVFGFLAFGLGMIGIFIPLLPTTPLILLSAFCFARSSKRLHIWLITHKRFGKVIRDWQECGSISKRTKTIALIMIALSPFIAYSAGVSTTVLIIQVVMLSCVSLFIITRPND